MLQSRWALICLLLFRAGTAGDVTLQCRVSPAGALHPVRAQLERFEAGPGCAAREGGAKETHVITVARPSQITDKRVTVVLRPLSYSHPVHRPVILVLSSQHAVRWILESEELPKNLHVVVQVSVNSTLENGSVSTRVHPIPSLPWRPRSLLRWTLQRHATISSLTHSASANRVYLRLGEDHTLMPSVCRLQSLFLSHNYMASTLQEQEVNGCTSSKRLFNPEVHIIKLWSAGSGLCGSLQVEVSVSLLPPVADAGWCNVVLVLSSAAPVNWALVTPGLRGHITVHSSHSMTPLYPPKPDLAMSSTVVPDLLTTPDLLDWAKQNGYPSVLSYTEAHLANRIVINLKGGAVQAVREAKVEETWLRRWMSDEVDEAAGSRKVVSIWCADGRLTVSVDKSSLQALALTVSAVTLRDPMCQAQSNETHFLLAFPVISCGTEGEMEQHGKEVQYKNTILLWRSKPSSDMLETTKEKPANETTPLVIHVRCSAPLPTLGSTSTPSSSSMQQGVLWSKSGVDSAPSNDSNPTPAPGPAPAWIPVPHGAPLFSMQLFATDRFEQRAVGPCVVTVQGRVYAEISGSVRVSKRMDVRSCVFSPISDPRSQTGWPIIRDFCPVDPSFLMHTKMKRAADEDGDKNTNVEKKREEGDDEERPEEDGGEGERDDGEDRDGARLDPKPRENKDGAETRRRSADTLRGARDTVSAGAEERKKERQKDTVKIRFSFILQPLFNNSIQFLHCSLQMCEDIKETHTDCTHKPTSGQCEYRNLSRPVLVTYLPDSLAGLVPPPAGKLAQKPGVTETMMSRHSSSNIVPSSVVISVIAAFLMGISLMGALWCIYSCTGRPVTARRNSLPEILNSLSPMSSLEQTTSSV